MTSFPFANPEDLEPMSLCPPLLIAAANAFYQLGNESRSQPGRTVRLILGQVKQPPSAPWDVAFVYHVGFWSHYNNVGGRSSWPLPATASAQELADFAVARNVLFMRPEPGDVFLLHDPTAGRFMHAGIVVDVLHRGTLANNQPYSRCVTIQGDTGRLGAPRGGLTCRVIRDFYPRIGDRFVRWWHLDPLSSLTDVRVAVGFDDGRMVVRWAA